MAIYNILTIAGSDSGGGAGIQADLKTICALGGYGASVLTAVTAQNTLGVQAVHALPAEFVLAQMRSLADDIRIDAIKIGMLGGPEIVEAVAEGLALFGDTPVILDPVMVAKSGDRLLDEAAIATLRGCLCSKACLITPNVPEGAVLLGQQEMPSSLERMEEMAHRLMRLFSTAVLLKGGHFPGPVCPDFLAQATGVTRLSGPRIETTKTHGTGCSLSAAIAALLPQSLDLEGAVRQAIAYVRKAIGAADALTVGRGHGPIHHFHGFFPQNAL